MIREVFSSIMGEGKFIGKRFIFVRFKECPLDCIYCDEPNAPGGIARVEEVSGSSDFMEYLDIENELIVITSYSIHYTKLYDLCNCGQKYLLLKLLDRSAVLYLHCTLFYGI